MCRPAHNGEALPGCLDQGRGEGRRVMPWEVLCPQGYDPVTTDPFGERRRPRLSDRQIYDRRNTRALSDKLR